MILYYMKYGPFVLATVRPETKFGDTQWLYPDDQRYTKYIGRNRSRRASGKFKLKVKLTTP